MNDKILDLELGNAVIKAIGIGELGESAINYLSVNKLKGITLYSRAGSEANSQINDADLLFLIVDKNGINDLMRIAKISNGLNILTIALIKSEKSDVIDDLKKAVDSFILLTDVTQ
ncbi:hypothetical protein BHECKSOX_1008 [Bathymodiolus heckerae thiotrophic gill symbiont]|uniref:hypothetical protein n=1 Tax=Bathymodiolus heckerae thiotrophic gill symbiont TaxID=1052212 RepID=UPI0010B8EF43|nr:hypothetical protein [Bathymodiolus heckerae thiotrophic gill symbiont]SHN92541.1 hypothetical protein BHECKSOX_1008 [Bathymodiolus heckerae thiotrophic gill symbiont]